MKNIRSVKLVHAAMRNSGYNKGTRRSWMGPSYRSWMSEDGDTMNLEIVSLQGSELNRRDLEIGRILSVISSVGLKCWSFGIHVYIVMDTPIKDN